VLHFGPTKSSSQKQRIVFRLANSTFLFPVLLVLIPLTAQAQGSPFDTGFNAIQALFTGTIAKVASLVAIVIGGYGFAHGEPFRPRFSLCSVMHPAGSHYTIAITSHKLTCW
jgi:type IV secretory pathway VirB2 component (pilin)